MRVILIGYKKSKIRDFLEKNHKVFFFEGNRKVSFTEIKKIQPDFIVLHGCHYILNSEIVKKFKRRIINCHGSILPYNRGAHPNVWSFIDNTPKGGTVHYIDENIDEGEILGQAEVEVKENDTLASVYWRIRDTLENLFIELWHDIIQNNIKSYKPDLSIGKLHYRKDLSKLNHILTNGWNTPVKNLRKT